MIGRGGCGTLHCATLAAGLGDAQGTRRRTFKKDETNVAPNNRKA